MGWGALNAVFRYLMGSAFSTEVHSKRSEATITRSSKENFD